LIVVFAHTLGPKVTVEGVERDRQVESLMAMRCEMVQGFYFSRPLPSEAAEALVATNSLWQVPR
jgi:EAL domain-containing protein (putative c-di-GMP-specific phosphodiesterase class I)